MNPGDIVFAEFDGILVVPRADAVAVLEKAEEIVGGRGTRARRGRGRRLALVELRAAWPHLESAPGARASPARALDARRSAIREVFDAANRIPDAIRLEIGEPSFRTPAVHRRRRARGGRGRASPRYTPNGGYLSLREALAEKIERVDGYAVDPDSVVVTPGAMNALFSIYLALLEPGDEVLLPTPGFPNMDEMVRLLGGDAGLLPARARRGLPPVARRRSRPLVTLEDEGDLRQHARQPDGRGLSRRDGPRRWPSSRPSVASG